MESAGKTAGGGFDPALLKELEAALAPHLGPIARVAVHDAAKTAGTLAELVRRLAWEIPDAAKDAFQKKFSDVSWVRSQPASAPGSGAATSRAAAHFVQRHQHVVDLPLQLTKREEHFIEPIGRHAILRGRR